MYICAHTIYVCMRTHNLCMYAHTYVHALALKADSKRMRIIMCMYICVRILTQQKITCMYIYIYIYIYIHTRTQQDDIENFENAMDCVPRGERFETLTKIDVNGEIISPLDWSISGGQMNIARWILNDLLTIRADRYMFVCVCVCACVYFCVYIYFCVYVYIYFCVYIYLWMWVWVYGLGTSQHHTHTYKLEHTIHTHTHKTHIDTMMYMRPCSDIIHTHTHTHTSILLWM